MNVTVKLFATLRNGRFDIKTREFNPDSTVRDVIREIDVPEEEVALIFLNSRHANLDTVLADGDIVALFPPIGGG